MTTAIEREQGADPTRPSRLDRRNAEARTGQWLLEVDRAWLALRRGSPNPEVAQLPELAQQGLQTGATEAADADFLRPQGTTVLDHGHAFGPTSTMTATSASDLRETETAPQARSDTIAYGQAAPADRASVPGQHAIASTAASPSTGGRQPDLAHQGSGLTPSSGSPTSLSTSQGSGPMPLTASPAPPGARSQTGGNTASPVMQDMPSGSPTASRQAGIMGSIDATPPRPANAVNPRAERARDSFAAASFSRRATAMTSVSAVMPRPSLTVTSMAPSEVADPRSVIPSPEEHVSALDVRPMPESDPAADSPAAGEPYSTRHVHVQVDDDGVHAYLRDANLDRTDAFAIAQAIYEQTMLDQASLASVTVNGTLIPKTPRLGRIESTTVDSSDDDDTSLTTEFRAQRSIAL